MPNLTPITQKQARIELSALPGIFWTSIKGGKLTKESVKYNDGSENLIKTTGGIAEIEDLTLAKPHDPAQDGAIAAFITAQSASKTPFNVVVTPVATDVQGTAISGGKPITYSNCTFLAYTPAQFDRDGTGLAKVEMMIAVNAIPSYNT